MSEPLLPFYLKAVRQNGLNRDCTIATIATFAGINYEEALAAALLVEPGVLGHGMTWPQIRRACHGLQIPTRLKRRGQYDLEEETGILNVKRRTEDHVCFLWAGRIIEGNFEGWLDPEEYLRHYSYTPQSLLVRT